MGIPLYITCFALDAFKILSMSLDFNTLIMCLDMSYLLDVKFIFFGTVSFPRLGQFLATVHLCTFSVLLFLLLFWGSMTQMLDLFSQSYRPMRLCSFSSAIYFLLMFRAGNFYCSFSSLIIFLVLSILLLSQSTALFLKIIYCIFQLHNFHLLLLYIFWFFVEIFSLSPVFFFF